MRLEHLHGHGLKNRQKPLQTVSGAVQYVHGGGIYGILRIRRVLCKRPQVSQIGVLPDVQRGTMPRNDRIEPGYDEVRVCVEAAVLYG